MDPLVVNHYESLCNELCRRIESQEFLERHRQRAKDFIRERQLTFRMHIDTLLNMLKRSLRDERNKCFASSANQKWRNAVRRRVLSIKQGRTQGDYCTQFQLQVAHCHSYFVVGHWLGYRLLGIDGSLLDLLLNAATIEAFGRWCSCHDTKKAKARVSQLFALWQLILCTIEPVRNDRSSPRKSRSVVVFPLFIRTLVNEIPLSYYYKMTQRYLLNLLHILNCAS